MRNMALYIIKWLSLPLLLLSLYATKISYLAIKNLQKYEERSEKAAKYFDKAARDLYKTRVTQASGAAAVRTYSRLVLSHLLLFLWFYMSSHVCLLSRNQG